MSKTYDVDELEGLFDRLVESVYVGKYDIRNEGNHTAINRVMPNIKNLFVSPYEYLEEKSNWLGKIGGSMLKIATGMFSIGGLLPHAKL